MRRILLRSTFPWLLLFVFGCSAGGSCGGCAEPIPGGFVASGGTRYDNGISVKVTGDGLRFVEANVDRLISAFAGGLALDVPCTQLVDTGFDIAGFEIAAVQATVCDIDRNNRCDGTDASIRPVSNDPAVASALRGSAAATTPICRATASIVPGSLSIQPEQTIGENRVRVPIRLQIEVLTGPVYVRAPISILGKLLSCTMSCFIAYDTKKVTPDTIQFDATLHLEIEKEWGHVVSFNIAGLRPSALLRTEDLTIGALADNTCGIDFFGIDLNLCDSANFLNEIPFIRDQVMQLLVAAIEPMLNAQVTNLLDGVRCAQCDASTPCPTGPAGQQSVCGNNGLCYFNSGGTNRCVPVTPGLEGRISPSSLAAGFGIPNTSLLDIYAVAGGRIADDDLSVEPATSGVTLSGKPGLVLGVMTGTRSALRRADATVEVPGRALCVPARQDPTTSRSDPSPLRFDQIALAAKSDANPKNLSGYHVGLGLSDIFLDKSLFDAYQGGLLCLNVDSSVSAFLSSSIFKTFLPSLGLLTHGDDVPMLIALRPKESPSIVIGKGTMKRVDGEDVPDEALLTIDMRRVQLDFYALIEDRQTRVFSLTTDIQLPLSLEFGADNTVKPVLADLRSVVSNIEADNSEMLAENPQIVADLIDAIIGLLQPVLASVLAPFELPTFNGLRLKVLDARGANLVRSGEYEHLAIFSALEFDSVAPFSSSLDVDAEIVETRLPTPAEMKANPRMRPSVTVQARGLGLRPRDFAGYEFSWRIDGGLWSPWTTRTRFEIRAPVLLFQGRHHIEIRTRERGVAASDGLSPASLLVDVDYEPPRVRLERNTETEALETIASDAVSRPDELLFRYRRAGEDWSMPGGMQVFSLGEIPGGALEVEVTDSAGNTATARYGVWPSDSGSTEATERAGGCSQLGLGSASALAALLLLRRNRKRR